MSATTSHRLEVPSGQVIVSLGEYRRGEPTLRLAVGSHALDLRSVELAPTNARALSHVLHDLADEAEHAATRRRFLNALRILHSIDHNEVPFLSAERWASFRDDPFLFLMRADDETTQRIWSIIEGRQP